MRKREKDEEVPVDDDLYEQAKRASEDFARRSRNRAIAFAEKEEQEEEEADRRDLGSVTRDALRGESQNAKTEQPVDIYAKNDARVQPDGKWDFQRPSPEKETDKKETANPNFFGSNDASGDVARLSELMSRYREASQRKQRDDDLGFVFSMTQNDPNAQRSLREGYSKAADEGIESIDRELSGFKKQVDNDSSLLTLARKRAMMDPNSPISKALREYEARNKQFGVGEDGLSAQDFVDTGRTTNPVFQTVRKSEDFSKGLDVKQSEGEKERGLKGWQTRFVQEQENERAKAKNATTIAAEYIRQKTREGSNEQKNAMQLGSLSVGVPPTTGRELGAQPNQILVPKGPGQIPTQAGQKRTQEIIEFGNRYINALKALEQIRDADPSRLGELASGLTGLQTQLSQMRDQYAAFAAQGDTKFNDNGVLNPGDLVKAIEALGGNPGQLKSALLGNNEIANGIRRARELITKSIKESYDVYNYRLGTPDEVIGMATGAGGGKFRENPVNPADPNQINSLINQATGGVGAPGAPKPAVNPATPPTTTDQQVTITLRNGKKWTGPRSKAVAAGYLKE